MTLTLPRAPPLSLTLTPTFEPPMRSELLLKMLGGLLQATCDSAVRDPASSPNHPHALPHGCYAMAPAPLPQLVP